MKIPYIPEDAPFNGDQRAWLAGFLAGLHSRTALSGDAAVSAAAPKAAQAVLNVLFEHKPAMPKPWRWILLQRRGNRACSLWSPVSTM